MGVKKDNEQQKAALRKETHNAALVLVDDLQYIREIVLKEEPAAGDLRRMSNLLRRILVEADLRKIADPRLGKIHILAPDLRSWYRENERQPFLLLAADTFETHGMTFSVFSFEDSRIHRPRPADDPERRVSLPIEVFQNQKVLCFQGKWVSRAEIIKYVANVGHGTHSGSPRTETASLISKIRHIISVKLMEI